MDAVERFSADPKPCAAQTNGQAAPGAARIVTRFRPTSGSGPLHAGHLINAYAALLYAKRHGGEFMVICDPMHLYPDKFRDFPPDEIWPVYRENWELLERLFPGKKLINTALNSGLALRLLSVSLGDEITSFIDPFIRSVAFDFLCGVNVLFRGRDWDPASPHAISEQLAYAYTHQCYLDRWRKQPTPVYYTPLLVDRQRKKLSKSRKEVAASLASLEAGGIAKLSLFAYVASLLADRDITCFTELASFQEVERGRG